MQGYITGNKKGLPLIALRWCSKIVAGIIGMGFVIYVCALLFRANTAAVPVCTEASELENYLTLPTPFPVNVCEVNYSEGAKAAWFPKGESPVLSEMVRAGKLPPVSQRVGSEPRVVLSCDGIGNYGGSIYRLNELTRFHGVGLLGWSPCGEPVVANVAKSCEVSDNYKVFTIHLRKGMRWSDGHPYTADDILFAWHEVFNDPALTPGGPSRHYRLNGKLPKVESPDAYTIRFLFDDSNPLFIKLLAYPETEFLNTMPKHFLEKFHPRLGDQKLIDAVMKQHNLMNKRSVFTFVQGRIEKPVITAWMRRTEKLSPPFTWVRNPYYYAVDPAGNQLPYADRIVCNEKSTDMLVIAAAQGEATVQERYIRPQDYTMLMRQRKQYGYQLRHWIGDGSGWGISLNINRRISENDLEAKDKAKLLADKRFRQALSLALDRPTIVEAMYGTMTKPASFGPMSASAWYNPQMGRKYSGYAPEQANRLLDDIGLTARDPDGFRRFPDGHPLLFDLNYCMFTGEGPAQFVVEYWRNVGINVRLRLQDRSAFYVEKSAGMHDMNVWGGYGEFDPTLDPRYYFPYSVESNFALQYASWFDSGGLYKAADDPSVGGKRPAENSDILKAMRFYLAYRTETEPSKAKRIFMELMSLAEENVYIIDIHTAIPQLCVVKDGFKGVPVRAVYSFSYLSPANYNPESWYFEKPVSGITEQKDIIAELSGITPVRPLVSKEYDATASSATKAFGWVESIVRWSIIGIAVLLLGLIILRNPFVAHRVLVMVPMLFIISVVSFLVVDLPQGDAISSRVMQMQEAGGVIDEQEIQNLKELFRLNEPIWKRYCWWMGLDYFLTFDQKDEGLLQGNMGRSMLTLLPVNQSVSDRLLFTVILSVFTVLFTYLVAIPIGVYSSVRQYSLGDYAFTIIGFIGMCVPEFLLALLLMYGAETWFGISASGLFSPEYAAQTSWTWGKFIDMMKHMWLPILVLGIGGTAGMIRVLRANLLDELKKPYVTTALAKGMPPLRLLVKYPIRVALNPFISGIGGLLPGLISGGAIISIVMSLPTIGPMQLDATLQQDMYLACSMLLLLSLLSVIGTLMSDLLLGLIDPRIRFQGGSK